MHRPMVSAHEKVICDALEREVLRINTSEDHAVLGVAADASAEQVQAALTQLTRHIAPDFSALAQRVAEQVYGLYFAAAVRLGVVANNPWHAPADEAIVYVEIDDEVGEDQAEVCPVEVDIDPLLSQLAAAEASVWRARAEAAERRLHELEHWIVHYQQQIQQLNQQLWSARNAPPLPTIPGRRAA